MTQWLESEVPAAEHEAARMPDKPRQDATPHTSIYLPRKVLKVIKQLALDHDVKPHDLLVEGVNLMLRPRPPLDRRDSARRS
jgi:hypothetical protein